MGLSMVRYLPQANAVAPRWRAWLLALAVGAGAASAVWAADAPPTATPTPAITPAAAASAILPEPAALPPDSPEQVVHDTLRDYLATLEPKHAKLLATQNLDRTQITARIKELEASGAGRPDDLLEIYLLYLTKLAPDPQSYLNIFSKYAWLLNQRASDPPLMLLVFNLTDYFPATDPLVQQVRLVQADFLLHAGLTESSLIILQKLCEQPGVLPGVKMTAAGRAGFMHERLGHTEQALKYYAEAGTDLTAGSQANEALLRAGLLQLELGRTDEALATIAKLKGVPSDLLRQSPAGTAVAEFLDLTADPARARAYWAHQEKWAALWHSFSAELGVKPGSPDAPLLAPYIDNYPQIAAQASLAISQKDTEAYFTIMDQVLHSARWRPSDLVNAAKLLYQGLSLAPAHVDEAFAFGVALEQDLPAADVETLKELAQLRVAALIDADKPEAGRDAAKAVLAKNSDGANGQALIRLYGFAVLKADSISADGPEAARMLAATFDDPAAHGPQRLMAALILSNLYQDLGRENDAVALLEKELATPARADENPDTRVKAAQELERLKQRVTLNANLNASLTAWWSQHQLPWFQFVTTSPQAGPLSTVDDPAVQVARDFARALDARASLATRADALQRAWDPYPDMPLTGAALVDATVAFAGREDMPIELRLIAWSKAMRHLLWTGQGAAAEKLLASAPATVSAEDKADFSLWNDYLKQPNTVAAQQAFADKVSALPKARQLGILLMVRVVDAMARLGAPDAALAVFAKFEKTPMDDLAAKQYQQTKASIASIVEMYRSFQPTYDALRALVLQARPQESAGAQLPQSWRDLNNRWLPDLALLPTAEVRQGLLAIIRDRLSFGQHPLEVFLEYGEVLSFSAEDNDLRLRLFETAQQLAQTDDQRYYAALFTALVDFDNPDIARRGWADLANDRVALYPKTAGFLQYFDALMKWRTGGVVDPSKAIGALDGPNLDPYKLNLLLQYYLQQGDRAGLQSLLDARKNEQDFLNPVVVGSYVRALRLLGKAAALTRATDAAQLELAKSVVQSWARPDTDTVGPVFDLARALNNPQAYPRAWMDAVLASVHNENDRDLFRMEDGQLQHNWSDVLDSANSYISRNPTSYDAYWPKAEALIELGRHQEALEPLRVYLKYSRNDDDYPAAAQWLKKIEAEPTPPITTAQATPVK